ncbi:MAG TPA: hypothetical protein VEG39_20225 [Clostridia bacterium]|nr:hypothetical protein [Clostridia bacterium]
MLNKKKMHFWRLTLIFGVFTLITLFLLWSGTPMQNAGMMDNSMGSMMKSMHLSNITIYDLFDTMNSQQAMSAMNSHHLNQAPAIYQLSFLTTGIIFVLLPFIIGGAILLGIVWAR